MVAPFGFSFGDFIACINVLISSINAVQDSKGASVQYHSLTEELRSLEAALSAIHDLHLDQTAANQYSPIQEAVDRCQVCIESFLNDISKYQPWLQPGVRGWTANIRKIQWAVCKKEDVARFQQRLERHSSSINMLLMTMQVSQNVERHQTLQSTCKAIANLQVDMTLNNSLIKGLSTQQADFIESLLRTNQQLANEVVEQRAISRLQAEIPAQVLLQKPVILLDACGKVAPFHLDFVTSIEALVAVLKIQFQQSGVTAKGLHKLTRSEFIFHDRRREIPLDRPWNLTFKPGQIVEMSMVFHSLVEQSTCPSCDYQHENEGCDSKEWYVYSC
ncbi:hypothetical protein MMC12_003585 [Toensbergia leucococca]|nr:hypothetical protein [Toensbergia leucococca]